jgi:hypothetical protein
MRNSIIYSVIKFSAMELYLLQINISNHEACKLTSILPDYSSRNYIMNCFQFAVVPSRFAENFQVEGTQIKREIEKV